MSRRLLFASLVGLALALWTGCSALRPTGTGPSPSSEPIVLATYADTALSLNEFEERYASSNGGRAAAMDDSMAAYRDFLERLVNFKLKVRAARAAGMDTTQSFQQEVRNYRLRMAEPRIQSERIMDPIIREVYERKQTEVDVSHILIRVPENAPPDDTSAAYNNLQTIVDSLDRGVSFADLAYRNSEDPSAQQQGRPGFRGRLGYVTAGQLVKPFEDRMYTTPVDSVSGIFRTRFGYHVLKVHDRRPRKQEVRLSHLFIRPNGQSSRAQAQARQKADSLHAELTSGAAFERIAREHSDDRRSAQKGGDLGYVQPSQRLPDAFLGAIDTLETGQTSDVLETRFGYHVLRLVDRKEQQSFEEAYDALKKQVSEMPRVRQRKASLAADIRAQHGATIDTAAVLSALQVASLDTSAQRIRAVSPDSSIADRSVVRIGSVEATIGAWGQYVRTSDRRFSTLSGALRAFVDDQSVEFAAHRLEQRDPAFAARMQEYREGVLLFQYMQDSVWTVASQDSALLRQTYRQNRDQYRFPDRVRTLALYAATDSLLQPYVDAHESGTSRRQVVQQAAQDSLVRVDTTHVTDASSAPYAQMQSVQDGTAAGPLQIQNESLYLIRDATLPARPKTFKEARSEVLSDAQDRYETQVHQRLRERYGATVYPERLQQVFDAPSPATAGAGSGSDAGE